MDNGEYEVVFIDELDDLDWEAKGYSNKQLKVFAPSREEHDGVLAKLRNIGIDYKESKMFGPPPFVEGKENDEVADFNLTVLIEGTIGKQEKRALVKVLFNYAAKYLGESETLKSEWNKARDFVRNDGETLLGRVSNKPFWTGQETEQLRFANDSYNLRIENHDGDVIGVIQLFNLLTYEFILVEGYAIPDQIEIAHRFTPGRIPYQGVKMANPNLP